MNAAMGAVITYLLIYMFMNYGAFMTVGLVAADTGKTLAQYSLKSLPVFDGLIAAAGRVYLTTEDGRVVCMEPKK